MEIIETFLRCFAKQKKEVDFFGLEESATMVDGDKFLSTIKAEFPSIIYYRITNITDAHTQYLLLFTPKDDKPIKTPTTFWEYNKKDTKPNLIVEIRGLVNEEGKRYQKVHDKPRYKQEHVKTGKLVLQEPNKP